MIKLLAFLFALAAPAAAQDITNHAIPVGGGPGFVGWKAVGPCTTNQVAGWAAGVTGDPSCITPIVSGGAAGGDLTGTFPNPTIAANAVTNAKLATMPANTVKCNATTSTAVPTDCQFPTLNVKDYGAVCNGAGDDSTAINNAIAALPTTGGIVEFPPTNCRITSTINIGNGTSAAASTRMGIVLRGAGQPTGNIGFPGFTATSGPKLTWAGGTGSFMINVNGPLQGWGVQNLYLDCANIGTMTGLQVISGQYGDSRNLQFVNCFRSITSTTVPLFGSFTNTDSIGNKWYGTIVNVPATAGSTGIILSSGGTSNSNTDFNTFINTDITLPTSVVAVTGLFFQIADTNAFYNLHIYGSNASATCVSFDYTGASTSFPSTNRLMGVDLGTCNGGTVVANGGTPGAGARPNIIYADEANGMVLPILANLMAVGTAGYIPNAGGNTTSQNFLAAWSTFTPSGACGTATFTNNTGRRMTMGKTTYISANFTINAIGTCAGLNLTFTLPNTNQSFGSIVGRNTNNGRHVSCQLTGGTTATCSQEAGVNFAASDNIVMSGVYENQ